MKKTEQVNCCECHKPLDCIPKTVCYICGEYHCYMCADTKGVYPTSIKRDGTKEVLRYRGEFVYFCIRCWTELLVRGLDDVKREILNEGELN